MKCKICQQNETDSTSGICGDCINKWNRPTNPIYLGETFITNGTILAKRVEYKRIDCSFCSGAWRRAWRKLGDRHRYR